MHGEPLDMESILARIATCLQSWIIPEAISTKSRPLTEDEIEYELLKTRERAKARHYTEKKLLQEILDIEEKGIKIHDSSLTIFVISTSVNSFNASW